MYMCSESVNSTLSKVCAFACFLYPQEKENMFEQVVKAEYV